ncbi:hypothetical protein BgiBS90_004531 [Biomphalaria glabrata]|nr:hypothetical protein BgiBS90_004531 [Biomphalaria glabrata]
MASSSNRLATPEAIHHSHRGHRKQGHSHRHGSKSPQPGKERSSGERSDKNWTSTRHTRDDEDEFRRAQCLRTSKEFKDLPVLRTKDLPVLRTKDLPVLRTKDLPVLRTKDLPVLRTKDLPVLRTKDLPVLRTKDLPVLRTKDLPVLRTKDLPLMKTKDLPLVKTKDFPLVKTKDLPVVISKREVQRNKIRDKTTTHNSLPSAPPLSLDLSVLGKLPA